MSLKKVRINTDVNKSVVVRFPAPLKWYEAIQAVSFLLTEAVPPGVHERPIEVVDVLHDIDYLYCLSLEQKIEISIAILTNIRDTYYKQE